MNSRIISLALGVVMASSVSSSFAADGLVAVPDPVYPVVTIVTLPVTVPVSFAGAVLHALAPPPPAAVVAKY